MIQNKIKFLLKDVLRNGILAVSRTGTHYFLMKMKWFYYTKCWGMDIHSDAWLSLRIKLDRTNPKGIHIGQGTLIAYGTVILTHDFCRGIYNADTFIGENCCIGANSFILPGIKIGNHCVVGAMSVITKDIPPRSLVAGNPARIIRSDIMTGKWGRIIDFGRRI